MYANAFLMMFEPFVHQWHDRFTFCRGGESKAWDEVPETAQSEDTHIHWLLVWLPFLEFSHILGF